MPRSTSRTFDGTDATASDNVELINIGPEVCREYDQFTIQSLAGTVDVEVAIRDGDTPTGPIELADPSGAALASDEVPVGGVGILRGQFDRVIVRKKGITNPTTAVLRAGIASG